MTLPRTGLADWTARRLAHTADGGPGPAQQAAVTKAAIVPKIRCKDGVSC
jgi:hypothetical protein